MNHSTHCKFCHKPITVEVDDDYAKLGDPYKLLQKAACNACADVRMLRRVLEERISRVSTVYAAIHHPSDSVKINTRKSISKLLQAYCRMIARWNRLEGMAFDEAAVDTLMEHPSQWAEVLSNLWKVFRHWQQQRELEV